MVEILKPKDILARAHKELLALLSGCDLVGFYDDGSDRGHKFHDYNSFVVNLPDGRDVTIDGFASAPLNFSYQDLVLDLDLFAERFIYTAVTGIARMLMRNGGTIATVPLQLPGGLEWSEGINAGSLSMRLVRGYDVTRDRFLCFLDVRFGIAKPLPKPVDQEDFIAAGI